MRSKLKMFASALAMVFVLASSASAVDMAGKKLVPVGETVGVRLFSDGIMVVGVDQSSVEGCGLEKGDIITHVNNSEIDSVEQLKEMVTNSGGSELSVRATRDGREIIMEVRPVMYEGNYRLGLWIRDSMAGIGTMTFYDPETGFFGALGHGVNDVDTGTLLPLAEGAIMDTSVASVKKGVEGKPGQLTGSFDRITDVGVISANTNFGIFGFMTDDSICGGRAIEAGCSGEVENGAAEILSNVEGDKVERFTIEIVKQNDSRDNRNMVLKVTDQRLLNITGGIVQGMSGSPIIQNGKLIGAVTHVLVNDPTRGYGVYIENMLENAPAQ